MTMTRVLVAAVLTALALAAPAAAQDPDPEDFTPVGYDFCGWRDFAGGGWVMEWDDDLAGTFSIAFAREMTCRAARRNIARVRYTRTPPYRPTRRGYRCLTLESALEYSDVRCSRRGSPSVAFRYRTGS